MATSYTNPCGSGDRRTLVIFTVTGPFNGLPPIFLDGDRSNTGFYFGNGSTTILEFWFPSKKIIDEATWYQSGATAHGTWKWQGSNDRTTWTDVGSTFTLGGVATQTLTSLAGNTTAYLFYRLFQVSGVASSSPYLYEIEFKIDEGSGTTSYLHPLGSGNRTATITTSSSGITWLGVGTPTALVNGSTSGEVWWDNASAVGNWVQFDLGAAYVVQQARFRFGSGAAQGDWKLQRSPDGSVWTDLSNVVTFNIEPDPYVTCLNGGETNTTPARYYRLLGVSGSRTSGPYELEVEFMVGTASAPTEGRVTQDAIETLSLPILPASRVTQDAVELLSANVASVLTGTGDVTISHLLLAGSGTVSLPSGGGTGNITISHPLLAGTGTAVPPTFTGTGTVTLSHPLLSGVGTVSPQTRVTQALVELLAPSPPIAIRATQQAVETFLAQAAAARTTQLAVEVFHPLLIPARTTQLAVELFNAATARTRVSQEAVELFVVVPPCVSGDFPIDDAGAGGACRTGILA